MYNVIIVEDEILGQMVLKEMLALLSKNIKVVAICSNIENAIIEIEKYDPDIIFLDLKLGNQSGFELLNILNEKKFKTIITTAHNNFGIEAIKHQVIDYIEKPISLSELSFALEKVNSVLELQKRKEISYIAVYEKSRIRFINPDLILFLKADGKYTSFNLIDNKKIISSYNIGYYEKKLKSSFFFRTHRSFVINTKFVTNYLISDCQVQLVDSILIPVSEMSKGDFLASLTS